MYPDEDDFEEVYSGEGREGLVDNDGISPSEEGFMAGYDEDLKETENKSQGDQFYEDAFEKKSRRSKRKTEVFDEEEIEAEIEMR